MSENQQPLLDTSGLAKKQPDPCPRCQSRARINGACTSCGFGTTTADTIGRKAKPKKRR